MNKRKQFALIFLMIPVIIVIILMIFYGLASLLEQPTNRGSIYTIFAAIWLFGSLLTLIPDLLFSIIGLIYAFLASKEDSMSLYIIIGLIEIAIELSLLFVWIFAFLMSGSSI